MATATPERIDIGRRKQTNRKSNRLLLLLLFARLHAVCTDARARARTFIGTNGVCRARVHLCRRVPCRRARSVLDPSTVPEPSP